MVHVGAALPGYRQIDLEAHSVAEILAALRRLGEAVAELMEERGEPGAAALRTRTEGAVAALQARLDRVSARVAGRPVRRVVCLEWLDPFYCSGHWVPDLVERAGGTDLLGRPGVDSVRMEWQQVLDAQPEVLIAMPCSFDLARSVAETRRLAALPGVGSLPAVARGEVWAVYGERYFSGSSPRVVDGVEVLAALLHPEVAGDLLPADAAVRVELYGYPEHERGRVG